MHVVTIEELLTVSHAPTLPLCQYSFPITNVTEFLALGSILTSMGIAGIIGLQALLTTSDSDTIIATTSIVTIKVRHDTFLHIINSKVPNPASFDTGVPPVWQYNLALVYTLPGLCPIKVAMPILPALSLLPVGLLAFASTNCMSTYHFTWDPTNMPVLQQASKQLFIIWLNQLNGLVYTNLTSTAAGKGLTDVPPGLEGMVFVVLTLSQPSNLMDLGSATLARPVVIPIS